MPDDNSTPQAGAAPAAPGTQNSTDPTTTPPVAPVPAPAGADDTGLGEGGQRALERERTARRDAERAARDAQAELDRIRQESLTDQEKAVQTARREGERAGLRRVLEATVEAKAAGRMANPVLAARLLNLDEMLPAEGTDVDGDRVATAIDELLTKYPELATPAPAAPAAPTAPAPPAVGTAPGGPRSVTGSEGTFTRSQLRDPAFFEANRTAIMAAAAAGRITND